MVWHRVDNVSNGKSCYDGSPSPCDSCRCKELCAQQKLACNDLLAWNDAGDAAKLDRPRLPKRSTYERIFPGHAA